MIKDHLGMIRVINTFREEKDRDYYSWSLPGLITMNPFLEEYGIMKIVTTEEGEKRIMVTDWDKLGKLIEAHDL